MQRAITMLIADDSHAIVQLLTDAARASKLPLRLSTTDNGRDCLTLLNGSILDKLELVTTMYGGRVFGIAKTSGETKRIVPKLTLNVGGQSFSLERVLVYGPAYSGLINSDGILGSDVSQLSRGRRYFGAI